MAGWVSFSETKSRVSLKQVLSWYRVKGLRRSGRDQYRGRCPIHAGQGREAFHANLMRNVFHCFACGAGGNVLDFVAAMEGCSIRQAALRLAERYRWTMPVPDRESTLWWRRREAKLVTKKREVNPPLSFSLRVDGAHPYLAQRGLEPATAAHFAVGFFGGPGLMNGRVAIPVHNDSGQLVAYCGRAVDSRTPRYRFPAGFQKSRVLFNYHRALEADTGCVVIVEGFFDCMRVHQAGFPHVIALMGASLSEPQKELVISRFPQVLLLFDGDETGRAATTRIAAALKPACAVTELLVDPGCQPDQLSRDQIRHILVTAERRPGVAD